MTSLFPPFTRRASFRKQPFFYEAGRGVYYKSLGYSSPALNLNFTTGTLDSRITFSRGSNATLVDSTGKITYAPSNLCAYSETITNANWTAAGTPTCSASTAVSPPSGVSTLSKFALANGVAAAAGQALYRSLGLSGVGPVAIVLSLYGKAAEAGYGSIALQDSGGNGAYFNLETGTVIGTVGTGVGTIQNVGGGWYRCNVYIASTSNPFFYFYQYSGTGNGSSGFYVTGAQAERVTYQTTPSTYVATTASAYYGPRFDYDPVTLACKGLLIEEQRTNLVTYSEQVDNAAWAKNSTTVSANATTAPDGTSNADLFYPSTTGTFRYVGQQFTSNNTTTYTTSVYVKRSGFRWAYLFNNNGSAIAAWYDLQNGVLGTVISGYSATITNVGNSWFRITLTGTGNASSSFMAYVGVSDTDNTSTATASGTNGIYVWGVQAETGSFATSYIPTTTASVTRSADVASMTGSNFSSWYNQSAGTLVTKYDMVGLYSGSLSQIVATMITDNNNRMDSGGNNSSAQAYFDTYNGGVQQGYIAFAGAAANVSKTQAIAYAQDNAAFCVAGGTITTDTSYTPPTANQMQIGSRFSANYLNGHVASIQYYNQRLPNATLQQLTSPSLVPSMSLVFDTSSNSYIDANWSP